MIKVELGYFENKYNHKNQKTIVTNIDNIEAVGFVIKVGEADDKCDVYIDSDMVTVINKVKPDFVMISESDKTIEDFCKLIPVSCEIPNFDYGEVEEVDEGLPLEALKALEEEKDEEEEYGDFLAALEVHPSQEDDIKLPDGYTTDENSGE